MVHPRLRDLNIFLSYKIIHYTYQRYLNRIKISRVECIGNEAFLKLQGSCKFIFIKVDDKINKSSYRVRMRYYIFFTSI